MPFTMEGTTADRDGGANGMCVAAMVLGIIGLPAFASHIIPVLALVLGIVGYMQVSRDSAKKKGSGMAIAGMIMGGLGIVFFLMMDFS